MTFEQALTAIKAGKRVKRKHWDLAQSLDEWNHLGSVLVVHILADDWQIVEPPQPDPTIEELRRAVVALADEIRIHQGYLRHAGNLVGKLRRPTDQ